MCIYNGHEPLITISPNTLLSFTVELCAASACSLQRVGGVSWTAGSAGCAAAARYWEETDQYTTTAAPILSPRCTCSSTKQMLTLLLLTVAKIKILV